MKLASSVRSSDRRNEVYCWLRSWWFVSVIARFNGDKQTAGWMKGVRIWGTWRIMVRGCAVERSDRFSIDGRMIAPSILAILSNDWSELIHSE